MRSDTKKGLAAIIILAATIALLAVMARYLHGGFTVLQQVYLRVFVAFALALIIFHKHLRWHIIATIPLEEWGVIAFRAFSGYIIGVALITQAVSMTTIGNVTFIASLPLVPLLGFVFLKERVTWWKLLFIFGALFGVALMAINNTNDLLSWQKGDLLAAVATFGVALSYIGRKWHGPLLNNHEITTLTFVFGAGFALLLSASFGDGPPSLAISGLLWLGILFGGALSLCKLFLTNYGFQNLPAVQAGNLLTLEGVWGLLFGLLFYREWPTWRSLLGGAIIVTCAIGMNYFSRRGDAKVIMPN